MSTALVTGFSGFAGSYLCRELKDAGYTVLGMDRGTNPSVFRRPRVEIDRVPNESTFSDIEYLQTDLSDADQLKQFFRTHSIDIIFHLAGSALVPESWDQIAATLENNGLRPLSLLDAAVHSGWRGRFLFISSGEVYGRPRGDTPPMSEDSPLAPSNPYARAKLVAEEFLDYYNRLDGIEAIIARPFNHTGPGQSSQFAVPAFLERIKTAMESGNRSIPVGDLDAVRDFTDVRDVVRGYRLLCEQGEPGKAYNVCTGVAYRIGELLGLAIEASGGEVSYHVDPTLLRSDGPTVSLGDCERLKTLGWNMKIDMKTTMADMWKFLHES